MLIPGVKLHLVCVESLEVNVVGRFLQLESTTNNIVVVLIDNCLYIPNHFVVVNTTILYHI